MALRFFNKKKKGKKDLKETAGASVQDDGENDIPPSITESKEGATSPEAPKPVAEKTEEKEESGLPQKNHSPQEDQADKAKTAKRGFFSRFKKNKTENKQYEEPETPVREEGQDDQGEEGPDLGDADDKPEDTEVPPEKKKRGLFKRLRNRLSKTRKALVSRVDSLLLGKKEIDEALLEELEEILITSDMGVRTTMALIDEVREKVARKDLNNSEELKEALYQKISEFLQIPSAASEPIIPEKPHVIMVVGVNGVGKTTTIGKLAARHVANKKQVLLVAADTFRAAAVEQLEIWSQRVGTEIVRHKGKADPSAVAFDGMQAAISRNVDVVIIDTAGRLHTKVNLMEELKKIRRTVAKHVPNAPHETLLVLDATTGQNAISQAQIFHDAIGVSGIALTKLDGTAKGGVVVGICHGLGLPLKYIGVGEKIDDLQDFDPETFMKALF
jgi:fused signal recognition particle receptor